MLTLIAITTMMTDWTVELTVVGLEVVTANNRLKFSRGVKWIIIDASDPNILQL